MTPWWSASAGVWIGSIGGAAFGILGGALGTAAGRLAPRGRGRRVIFAAFALMVSAGVIALGAGLLALGTGQPRHVWYPLVVGGGIVSIVVGVQLPALRNRYRAAELRRLGAEELRRA